MSHLLDTDIISNLLKPVPSRALVRALRIISRGNLALSSITLGELLFGAHKRCGPSDALSPIIERLVDGLPILAFDEAAARQYGRVRAELERRGTPLADPDLRIACIALAQDLAVVTGNVRHFARVPGLRVENWFE